MNTKKTSSYKKDGDNKKMGRSGKYKKKEGQEKGKKEGFKKDFKPKYADKPKEKRNPTEEEKKEFNPYLNQMAHKYEIICFACEKKKMVAVEPFDGIPVICDECIVELEARRLMDIGGFQKTKKLKCKNCKKDFYALNESYLLCDECYDHFSHQIKARRKGLIPYECKNCGKQGFVHPKTLEEKIKNNDYPVCRDCMNKDKKDEELARKKERINKVKNRKKEEQ